jgi:hypothetical protein
MLLGKGVPSIMQEINAKAKIGLAKARVSLVSLLQHPQSIARAREARAREAREARGHL